MNDLIQNALKFCESFGISMSKNTKNLKPWFVQSIMSPAPHNKRNRTGQAPMDVVLGLFAGNPAQSLQMLMYVDGHEALGCHIQV